ncbi:hypothetical protein [Methanococcoides sp. FTZ1]|uniref:hypothetical protein n=1 Tax=Methanococcoides sp. FTZ1 TaxID=3439061 RepID=UPI003F8566E0
MWAFSRTGKNKKARAYFSISKLNETIFSLNCTLFSFVEDNLLSKDKKEKDRYIYYLD